MSTDNMYSDKELIIVDENILDAAEKIRDYGLKIKRYFQTYNAVLMYVVESAIVDEAISREMLEILDITRQLQENVTEITRKLKRDIKEFVEKVDESDKFLY